MKNLVWEYDALPHALICGGTCGGKTYFLLTIIEALLRTNADFIAPTPNVPTTPAARASGLFLPLDPAVQ